MTVSLFVCETRKGSELATGPDELEPEGPTDCEIALDIVDQHGDTSGHGWAISESNPRSTLA
jgi:hypothetical protein